MDWAIYLPFVYFIFWGILLQNAHFALENCIYIYERPTRFWYQPCVTLLRLAGKFFSGQPCVAWSLYCCCFCRPDLPVPSGSLFQLLTRQRGSKIIFKILKDMSKWVEYQFLLLFIFFNQAIGGPSRPTKIKVSMTCLGALSIPEYHECSDSVSVLRPLFCIESLDECLMRELCSPRVCQLQLP